MSRKLTLLQVNDNVLSRKQQLLQEREAGLRKVCDIIISLFVCSEVYMLVVYIRTYVCAYRRILSCIMIRCGLRRL